MVAPTLTSDHPGLELLAEVAKVLAAGRPAEEGLAGGVAVLRRGPALRRCRLWLRRWRWGGSASHPQGGWVSLPPPPPPRRRKAAAPPPAPPPPPGDPTGPPRR